MKTPTMTLRHLSFEITSLAKTLKFYEPLFKIIGFKKIMGDGKSFIGFSNGSLELFFCRSKPRRVTRKAPTGKEMVISDHVAFLVDSPKEVDRIAAGMKKAGFKPVFPPEESPEFTPGYYATSFADPDKVVLEFYYHPPVKKPK